MTTQNPANPTPTAGQRPSHPTNLQKQIKNKSKTNQKQIKNKSKTNGHPQTCSYHEIIAKSLDCRIFFANPYSSWERGLIENTNGLLRQYFPKAMAFDQLTQKMADDAIAKLNNRPRKTLDYDIAANRMNRSLPLLAA